MNTSVFDFELGQTHRQTHAVCVLLVWAAESHLPAQIVICVFVVHTTIHGVGPTFMRDALQLLIKKHLEITFCHRMIVHPEVGQGSYS